MNDNIFLDALYLTGRDVPFVVPLQPRDAKSQAAYLLKHNSGGCTAKHYFLGRIFQALGLSVNYLDFPFYWQDQSCLPDYLRDMALGLPLSHHLACIVQFNDNQLFVDATWDRGLARFFPVSNAPFASGLSCTNAVIPIDEPKIYLDLAERYPVVSQTKYCSTQDKKRPFYLAFNQYLAQVRADYLKK